MNNFDRDLGNGLAATEKFKKLKVSEFSMGIQKVLGKKKWRLVYPEALSTYSKYSGYKQTSERGLAWQSSC